MSDSSASDHANPMGVQNSPLMRYMQALHPEVVSRLSRPDSKDTLQVMEHNISGLLGHLPAEAFNVEITTNRENLGRLLASAMMSGYFLRNVEQRLAFERSLTLGDR